MKKTYEEIFDLHPIYSSQKSFGGKAKTVIVGYAVRLISYDTEIVEIENGRIKMLCGIEDLSTTTLKHLREFLNQMGHGDIAKLTKRGMINELYK